MESRELARAIHCIKSGQKAYARVLLQSILRADLRNETAWLWYADTFPTDVEREQALNWCLKYNPQSVLAQRGLEALRKREPKSTPSRPETAPNDSATLLQHVGDEVYRPISAYGFGLKHTRTSYEGGAGLSDLLSQVHEFCCEECGCELVICEACGLLFCEDCTDGKCDQCGMPLNMESMEDELIHEGYEIVDPEEEAETETWDFEYLDEDSDEG